MKKRLNIFLIVIILTIFAFSSSTAKQDINDLSYVVAIGIDVGENSDLKVSFQLSVPSAGGNSSSSEGSSGSSSESDTVIDTIECPSLESGISLANGFISKKLNLSHCKAIVISEQVASLGISDIIYTLINNPEVRPDCNVLISRATAYDFLSDSKSKIESITAKYYEVIATSSRYTGYTDDITISDVFNRITDTFGEASAILGSTTSSSNSNQNADPDTDTIAGETTSNSEESKQASTNIDVDGLAVFKGDILVGELTATETICHLIVTNKLEECIFSIPSPFDEDNSIDLYVSLDKNTNTDVKFVNGAPLVSCDVKLNARILSSGENSNYFEGNNLSIIEEYANSYVKNQIEAYFYKTSKEFNSDIALLGRHAVKYFDTWDKWVNYNWLDNYSNAVFDVKANVNVISSYLIS